MRIVALQLEERPPLATNVVAAEGSPQHNVVPSTSSEESLSTNPESASSDTSSDTVESESTAEVLSSVPMNIVDLVRSFSLFKDLPKQALAAFLDGGPKLVGDGAVLLEPERRCAAVFVSQGKVRLFVDPAWVCSSSPNLFLWRDGVQADEIVEHLIQCLVPVAEAKSDTHPSVTAPSVNGAQFVHLGDFVGPLLLNVAPQFASCIHINPQPRVLVQCVGNATVVDFVNFTSLALDPDVLDVVRGRVMSIHKRFMPPRPCIDSLRHALGPGWKLKTHLSLCSSATPFVLRKGDNLHFRTQHPADMSVYIIQYGALGNGVQSPTGGGLSFWPSHSVSFFGCHVCARAVVSLVLLVGWTVTRADYLAMLVDGAKILTLTTFVTRLAKSFFKTYGFDPRFALHVKEVLGFPTLAENVVSPSTLMEHKTDVMTATQRELLADALQEGMAQYLKRAKRTAPDSPVEPGSPLPTYRVGVTTSVKPQPPKRNPAGAFVRPSPLQAKPKATAKYSLSQKRLETAKKLARRHWQQQQLARCAHDGLPFPLEVEDSDPED